MKRLLIITSGPQKNREDFFNYNNLMTIKQLNDLFVDVKFVTNNQKSLAEVYNRHLLNPENRESNIVFVHSDAYIRDPNFVEKVSRGLDTFDIVGVAGCIPPFDLNRSGGICTWHNMGLPENRFGKIDTYRQKEFGAKYEYNDPCYRTDFGPTNKRVLLADGVFLGVNVSKVWPLVQFDEKCPAKFHFYDLLFTLLANKRGLSVGVIGMDIVHCSPGLRKFDAEFFAGNHYFGEILHKEGFLPAPPPKKPNIDSQTRVEISDQISIIRTSFPLPINRRIPMPPFPVSPGSSTVFVKRSLKHGGKIGKNTDGVPNYIHIPSDQSGCSWWRLCLIDQYGNYSNKANVMDINTMIGRNTSMIGDTSFWDRNFDAVRIQREFSDEELKYYRYLNRMFHEREYKTKLIWEIDDIVIGKELPKFNAARNFFQQPHIQDNMKRIVDLCDHITVVSEFMKEMYEPFFAGKEIRVLENYSHKGWFDGLYDFDRRMRLYEENKRCPRILLAGGGTHFLVGSTNPSDQGDYSSMIDTIIKTRKDFKWCFMGHIPAGLEPFVDNGDMEFIPWANLVEYPVKLEETNAQVLLAPLEPNDFNRSKSNIKERESYYLGRPCVVQDLEPYKTALHKFNTPDEAIDQIKSILKDEQTYGDLCKKYRSLAKGVWLEDVWDSKVVPAYA